LFWLWEDPTHFNFKQSYFESMSGPAAAATGTRFQRFMNHPAGQHSEFNHYYKRALLATFAALQSLLQFLDLLCQLLCY
jgi:hypothetical protein